ncbi:MAG: amidohydrolase family protein, partial [Bacteroidota bacterium]
MDRHPVAAYFVLTYAISWGLWLPIVLGYDGALREALFVAGIFGPALAGAAVTKLSGDSVGAWLRRIVRFRVGVGWYLAALLIPVLLIGAVSAVYAALGNPIDVGLLSGRAGAYAGALVSTALLGGGQEEFGWRGFVLPHLERAHGPVVGTLILGVLWGLWHLPIVAADPEFQHGLDLTALLPVIGLTLVSVIGYAFLLTWLFNRTASVILAMLLHAGFNTANELLVPIPLDAAEGANYATLSVVMTLALVLVSLVLIVVTRGRLGYRGRTDSDESDEGGPPARPPRRAPAVVAGVMLLAVVVPAEAQSPPEPLDLVIANVAVVDVEAGQILPGRDVLISGDRIVGVPLSDPTRWRHARRVIDGGGRYVMPGLWDMHTHALWDSTQASYSLPLFLAHGVTGIRDVGSPLPLAEQRRIAREVRRGLRPGPRIVPVGTLIDGPPGAWPGVRVAATAAEGEAAVEAAAAEGWTAVKTYSLLPPEAYRAVARAADRLGLDLYGHVPDAITVREALAAGQRSIEHLGGKLHAACSPLEADLAQRRAAVLQEAAVTGDLAAYIAELRAQADEAVETFDATLCVRLAADLAAAGTTVAPTLVVADFYAGRDPAPDAPRMRTVPAAMRDRWAEADFRRAGFTDADRARTLRAEQQGFALLRALRDAGVPILASTDAGWINPYSFYGASLHDELERYVAAGLSPADALRAATLAPARFFGCEHFGRVVAGNVADLVILDADPLAD